MKKLLLLPVLCGLSFSGASASLHAQTPGDTWHNLQALPAHSHMHVSADGKSATCYLISSNDTTLTCGNKDGSPKSQHVFARSAVKSVKLTRYGMSTLAGAGIGAAGGAVAGFATTRNPNGWFNGDVRAIFTVLGAGIGAAIGGPTDMVRGPVVYRRS